MDKYEKCAAGLMELGDKILEKKKHRNMLIRRVSLGCASAFAAVIVGFFAWKSTPPKTDISSDNIISESTAAAASTYADTTSPQTTAPKTSSSKTTAKAQTTATTRTNTVRAAVTATQARTTALMVTAAAETTTITEYEEGSVTMKKMIAYLAAMGIATTANPTGVYAENPNKIRFSWDEISFFSLQKDENWKYDMNNDGDFDIEDIFELKLYSDHVWHYWQEYREDQSKYADMYKYYDEETFKQVKKIMHNEDIKFDILPFDITSVNLTARYYLYLNGEYPTIDEIRETLSNYDFMTVDGPDHVEEFIEYMEKLRSEVKTYEDKDYTEAQLDCFRRLDSGETEKDVNGDGEFNYFDVYDILGYVINAEMIARNMSIERDGIPMSDDLNKRVEQYGDMDLDGEIDGDDLSYLALYLDKMNLKPLPITDHLKVMKTYTVSGAKEFNEEMNKYNALNYTLGDVDNSGAVNAIDASLVLDYYSRVSTGKSESLDDTQKKAADADKDGSINAVDASLILSYYVYTSTSNGAVEPFETFMNM
ncbi:dockerin type I domain-containing protein [Ruminococcus flavefaciens]|uniref:dockerin type I domain-containing protein n=1 Tax=Ruminococcus flavefaciens TaxID=1265 RepID=UPI0026F1E823|nr:dockerin type I domain-containing protein [Ruminococcus flavefaciens]